MWRERMKMNDEKKNLEGKTERRIYRGLIHSKLIIERCCGKCMCVCLCMCVFVCKCIHCFFDFIFGIYWIAKWIKTIWNMEDSLVDYLLVLRRGRWILFVASLRCGVSSEETRIKNAFESQIAFRASNDEFPWKFAHFLLQTCIGTFRPSYK